MTHEGNLVGLRGRLENGRQAAALRALQILEDHDGHLRAFGRTQHRVHRLISGRPQTSSEHQYQQRQKSELIPGYVFHRLFNQTCPASNGKRSAIAMSGYAWEFRVAELVVCRPRVRKASPQRAIVARLTSLTLIS